MDDTARRRLLSVDEASREYGISRGAIYGAMRDHRLAYSIPTGAQRGRKVSRSDMDAWVASWRVPAIGGEATG